MYVAGRALETDELFFNRKEDIDKLNFVLSGIEKGVKQDVAIFGPRRIGKSSLLKKMVRDYSGKKPIFVFIDCDEVVPFNEAQLFLKIGDLALESFCRATKKSAVWPKLTQALKGAIKEVLATIKEIEIADYITIRVDFSKGRVNWDKLAQTTIETMNKLAEKENKYFVLVMDEVGRCRKFGDDFLSFLRSMIQHKSKRIVWVLSSSTYLHSWVIDRKHPFFQMFETIQLKKFKEKDAIELIKEPAEKINYKYSEGAVKKILELTGGHPYYIQAICRLCLNKLVETKSKNITEEVVESAYPELFVQYYDHFKRLFDDAKAQAQQILIVMAKNNLHKPVEIAKASGLKIQIVVARLVELIPLVLVERESEGYYKIIDTIFEEWIRRNYDAA